MKKIKCLVCGKSFLKEKSMTNHRRHHNREFSDSWSEKMKPFRVKKHSDVTKFKISRSLRSEVKKPDSSRSRARYDFKRKPCELCGKDKSEIHHIDGNPFNNKVDNITFMCRKHHMLEDGRMENFIKESKKFTSSQNKDYWISLGKKGGAANLEKGVEYFRMIGKISHERRAYN